MLELRQELENNQDNNNDRNLPVKNTATRLKIRPDGSSVILRPISMKMPAAMARGVRIRLRGHPSRIGS